MPNYEVTQNVKHDGAMYRVGDIFPETAAPPEKIEALVSAGALRIVEEQPAETQETTPEEKKGRKRGG